MGAIDFRRDAFNGALTAATHFIEVGIAAAQIQAIQVIGDGTIVCSAITLQTSNVSKEEAAPPVQSVAVDAPSAGASTTSAGTAGVWFDEPVLAFPALTLNAAAKPVDM